MIKASLSNRLCFFQNKTWNRVVLIPSDIHRTLSLRFFIIHQPQAIVTVGIAESIFLCNNIIPVINVRDVEIILARRKADEKSLPSVKLSSSPVKRDGYLSNSSRKTGPGSLACRSLTHTPLRTNFARTARNGRLSEPTLTCRSFMSAVPIHRDDLTEAHLAMTSL